MWTAIASIMMRRMIAILFLFAGCVDGSDSDKVEPTPVRPDKGDDGDGTPAPDPGSGSVDAERELQPPGPDDTCQVLPQPGPCEYACQPEILVDLYVPEGTCAMFECPVVDGTTTTVGGCR